MSAARGAPHTWVGFLVAVLRFLKLKYTPSMHSGAAASYSLRINPNMLLVAASYRDYSRADPQGDNVGSEDKIRNIRGEYKITAKRWS